MRLFAIADLHLPGVDDKSMDIFGDQWKDHALRIEENWRRQVAPQDVVLIPGDISWAMRLSEAQADLAWVGALPGTKVMIRGNHDYWWSSIGRVRGMLAPGLFALQNDSVSLGPWVITGSRGWTCPGINPGTAEDMKIYQREGQRLALSLQDGQRRRQTGQRLVTMLHFPPFNERQEPSLFTQLCEQENVDCAVYGHLHGVTSSSLFEGLLRGVQYRMVACDYLDFNPALLDEV